MYVQYKIFSVNHLNIPAIDRVVYEFLHLFSVMMELFIIIILFHHFICSKTKDAAMRTKDMDVEQDTSGSDKLLRWSLKKKYGNTQIHKI